MGNMKYCMFENTYGDLKDCLNHIHDKLTSHDEILARTQLIQICRDIIEEVENPSEEEDNENMDDDESS